MKAKIKALEDKIQKEIWRQQMLDYVGPTSEKELKDMQKDLIKLKALSTKEVEANRPKSTKYLFD